MVSRDRFDALYRAHAGFVWRAVQRFGVPAAIAEDAVQDVFMVARRRLHELDPSGSARAWLYGIARGTASNVRRGQARAARKLAVVEAPSAPESPELVLERARATELVERFLAELDPHQREIFELVDIEGLRGPEVAELLDENLNVVYSRLRLARRRFVAFLDAHTAEPVRERR